jgi:glycosyltransferase involved in cell wall biosynthesis
MTQFIQPSASMENRTRCLWIARYIPYPMYGGAEIYSANLAQALARAGAFVRFMGLGNTRAVPETAANVDWLPVPGGKRSRAVGALSALPIAAAIDATKSYRLLLETQLQERWDAIVLDGYGAGWALERSAAYCAKRDRHRAILVHVSHNYEELLWRVMGREARGSLLKRFALKRNATKVATLERRIVRAVDLLTTITDEDRDTLGSSVHRDRSLSLTPGYTGQIVRERCVAATTPRRVIIMGSFQWVVKQDNLARFLQIADPIFREQGIILDVVGDIPSSLLATLRARCRATCFHGFVSNTAPFLASARIGIVPESIGGGFKLKFLDYIFSRVPVATVSQAVAGLSPEIQQSMLKNDSLEGLVSDVVSNIDRFEELNRMQERAFTLGTAQFEWNVRGQRFLRAITSIENRVICRHDSSLPMTNPHGPGADLAAN